jgi:hypothetical protein
MRDGTTWRRFRVAGLAAVALSWAAAAAAQVGYTGSVYFVRIQPSDDDRTDAVYLFNSIDFERGPVRGSLTLPLIVQQSSWVDPEFGASKTPWQSGLADPTVRADMRVWQSRARDVSVRASGTVKIPVASVEDGYSSGKADVAFGMSLSTFGGRNSVLADFTYWIVGDPPEVDYRNVPAVYVGYARVLDRSYRWSGIVSVSGAPSAIPGFDPASQVSFAVLRLLGTGAAVGFSFDIGLTGGSSDFAVGSTWRFVF